MLVWLVCRKSDRSSLKINYVILSSLPLYDGPTTLDDHNHIKVTQPPELNGLSHTETDASIH